MVGTEDGGIVLEVEEVRVSLLLPPLSGSSDVDGGDVVQDGGGGRGSGSESKSASCEAALPVRSVSNRSRWEKC